jgi:hypothetical protein
MKMSTSVQPMRDCATTASAGTLSAHTSVTVALASVATTAATTLTNVCRGPVRTAARAPTWSTPMNARVLRDFKVSAPGCKMMQHLFCYSADCWQTFARSSRSVVRLERWPQKVRLVEQCRISTSRDICPILLSQILVDKCLTELFGTQHVSYGYSLV